MENKIKHIKFKNQQRSEIQFDIVDLEQLKTKKISDHSINEHHRIGFYTLVFIEKGQGFHTIDFIDYKCSEGTLLTIRKDQIHKFFNTGNLSGKLLIFTNEFLISYLQEEEAQIIMLLFNEQLGVPKLQLNGNEQSLVLQSIKRLQNEYFSINDKHSAGIIRSELHILISKLFRIKSKRDQIVSDRKYIKEFLQFQNLVEEKVYQTSKVYDYADLMGISSKTLNNVTRSVIHKSAKAFIDEIYIKQIKRLLLNTKWSIKEIAYHSGFEETTNFYKYFKRHTQSTPESFRALK